MMKADSRTEIVIVAGVAILLLLWWHRNRATQGNGLGLTVLPAPGAPVSNSGVPLDLTMPSGDAGDVSIGGFNYHGGSHDIAIGGVTYNSGSPGGCGCNGNLTGGPTYGSTSDLAAAMLASGYDQPFTDKVY